MTLAPESSSSDMWRLPPIVYGQIIGSQTFHQQFIKEKLVPQMLVSTIASSELDISYLINYSYLDNFTKTTNSSK